MKNAWSKREAAIRHVIETKKEKHRLEKTT